MMPRLTDKSFVYTPSHETDIGKRFRKIIAEQKRLAKERESKPQSVVPMKRVAK